MKKFILLTSICAGMLLAGSKQASALKVNLVTQDGTVVEEIRYQNDVPLGEIARDLAQAIAEINSNDIYFYHTMGEGTYKFNATAQLLINDELQAFTSKERAELRPLLLENFEINAVVKPLPAVQIKGHPKLFAMNESLESIKDDLEIPRSCFFKFGKSEITDGDITGEELFSVPTLGKFVKTENGLFRVHELYVEDRAVTRVEGHNQIFHKDTKVSTIRSIVQPPANTNFFYKGHQVDEDMDGYDLDPQNNVVLKIVVQTPPVAAQQPATQEKTYKSTVSVDPVPRRINAVLPAGATVADLERATRQKIPTLSGMELVATLVDTRNYDSQDIPKTMRLDELDLNIFDIVFESPGHPVSASPDEDAPVPVSDSLRQSMLVAAGQSMHPAPAVQPPPSDAVPEEGTPYKFNIPQRDIEIVLNFKDGATVLEARKKIAAEFNLPSSDYVTLLFSGKQLKDGFKIGRLRIGNKPVFVHLRDDSEVLVRTAKANRKK